MQVLGPAHSEVAMALQNYAMCLKAGGDLGQAEALFRWGWGWSRGCALTLAYGPVQ